MSSGAYIANNFRQGYRAEYLAQYVISEFGPCERIHQENDYEVDLIATIMRKVGNAGYVSLLYGIQVKSVGAPFHYDGDHLLDWIKKLNIPLLMCRADREAGKVELYSTWTIHDLVLQSGNKDIKEIDFVEGYGIDGKLKMPEIQNGKATVWLGKPIVDVSVAKLKKSALVNEIAETLSDWINCDALNYFRRNADIPVILGYLSWDTNKSLRTSQRIYYKPYYYSDENTTKAIKLIQDCATLIALNKGKDDQITKDLAEFVKKHGVEVNDFTKSKLGI